MLVHVRIAACFALGRIGTLRSCTVHALVPARLALRNRTRFSRLPYVIRRRRPLAVLAIHRVHWTIIPTGVPVFTNCIDGTIRAMIVATFCGMTIRAMLGFASAPRRHYVAVEVARPPARRYRRPAVVHRRPL